MQVSAAFCFSFVIFYIYRAISKSLMKALYETPALIPESCHQFKNLTSAPLLPIHTARTAETERGGRGVTSDRAAERAGRADKTERAEKPEWTEWTVEQSSSNFPRYNALLEYLHRCSFQKGDNCRGETPVR